MACLLGVQRSFEKAEVALLEVAGWGLDDNTIRQLCHATAARASSTRERRDTAEAFARAEGDLEMQVDAGKVNTRGGWRDVKVAVLARREPGASITASEWDQRDLPAPTVRSVVAAVEEAAAFGTRCAAETTRLGLTDPKAFHVLGDGAEWIWNLAEQRLPGASQCLDFWHGSGHLGAGAKPAGGRLLGCGRVDRGVGGEDAGRWRRGGVGGGPELFRGPPDAGELRAATATRAVDRERVGGGLDQAVAEREAEADGGPLEGRARRPSGGTGCLGRRARVGGVLETELT
jgi:hypothetical protein